MGVPVELVLGGLSWSGSNVSLRMLENQFLDRRSDYLRLVTGFIMPKISAFMGWEGVPAHFKRFKMADDLQRSAFNLQLNQAGKISDRTLLEDTDWDSRLELERIDEERKVALESQRRQALGQTSIQGEAQMAMQKYQIRAQKALEKSQSSADMQRQQQQEAAQMMQTGMMGSPGMSPMAGGQMMTAQQGMMNQMGMVPPVDVSQMAKAEQTQAKSDQSYMNQMGQQQQAREISSQVKGLPAPGPAPLQSMQSPMSADEGQPQMDVTSFVNKLVGFLDQMPANQQQVSLSAIGKTNPQLYSLVLGTLQSRAGAHQNSAGMPMPQQRTPRRGPEAGGLPS
jgi:hypothetical protein